MRGTPQTLVVALWLSFGVGCGEEFQSEEELPPCNTDPWSCSDEQTCWVNSAGDGFACMNPGPGASGESCQLVVGSVRCDTGLFCVQNVCRPFCDATDPSHACPDGMGCAVVGIGPGDAYIGDVQACVP